jgi:hypothetical protein
MGSNFNHRGYKVKKRGSLDKFKIFTNRKLQFTAGDNFIFNPVAWPLKSNLDPRFFYSIIPKTVDVMKCHNNKILKK